MSNIQILDQITIDKIAAGEVIERPASIVKELVENAIDAGATAITVEAKEGGIAFLRITDNGRGIDKADVPLAFLRHATSKIRSIDDLVHVASLGFRGEALSSIAAIAQVELITKTRDEMTGSRYVIEGGSEKSLEDIGAPDGTTFLVHQIFYNTPARRKFLKTPMTETSHISELMTRLALSHPEVSLQFIANGQTKLHTSGNGKLKDVIYNVFGREIANDLIEVQTEKPGLKITGLIGKPLISRGNRNYENYYINGRYVKSTIIAKAIEDAYKGFTMQHKYPFTVLHLAMDGTDLDVNVHPTKMELRFSNQQSVYNIICDTLKNAIMQQELIPRVTFPERIGKPVAEKTLPAKKAIVQTQPIETCENTVPAQPVETYENAFSVQPIETYENAAAARPLETYENAAAARPLETYNNAAWTEPTLNYFMQKMKERVTNYHQQLSSAEVKNTTGIHRETEQINKIREAVTYNKKKEAVENEQLNLFEEALLSRDRKEEHHLIGQLFATYWLVEFHEQLYIIDQHAAHERVLYERTLKGMREKDYTAQYIDPPIVLNLSLQESELLQCHLDSFTAIGFEIESFGKESYTVRSVPDNLFSIAKKELLIEMLDGLSDSLSTNLAPDIISEKIASMSCKAAVKGNAKLTATEMNYLIEELLLLDNPYHCPHGRPTIIAMTKKELEKKFKRIV